MNAIFIRVQRETSKRQLVIIIQEISLFKFNQSWEKRELKIEEEDEDTTRWLQTQTATLTTLTIYCNLFVFITKRET